MVAVLLGLAAALGTVTGLFIGMPAVGFMMWPLTRGLCRLFRVEIDPADADDRVMIIEGSLVAGLGMGLGVAATVALVGLLAQAPRTGTAAGFAGGVAGLVFGGLWRLGHRHRSAVPLVLITALLSALAAAVAASERGVGP